MKPPLHELVLAYKMDSDRVMSASGSSVAKLCAICRISLKYGETMKLNPEISFNDISVWGALFNRYMKQL